MAFLNLKTLPVVTITTATGAVVSGNLGNSELLSSVVSSPKEEADSSYPSIEIPSDLAVVSNTPESVTTTPSTVASSQSQSSAGSGGSSKGYRMENTGYSTVRSDGSKCNIYVVFGNNSSYGDLTFKTYKSYDDWGSALAEVKSNSGKLLPNARKECNSKKHLFVHYAYSGFWEIRVSDKGPVEIK